VIALFAGALAATPALDRVDLLSEHGAPWLVYEAPRIGVASDVVVLRWIEQVSPVLALGDARLSLSLGAQTIGFETPSWPWSASGGVVTRAGLPVGALAGVGFRPGKLRLGLSLALLSSATWVRPQWNTWTALPGVGVGIGRDTRPRAPWME
jgi:hypothetical protein